MTHQIKINRSEINRRVSFTAYVDGKVLTGKTGAVRYFKSEEAARKAASSASSEYVQCNHWPTQKRCGVCGMGISANERRA